MPLASHASIFMARFDEMRTNGHAPPSDSPGTLFQRVAADTRGAATEPGSQQAFRFLLGAPPHVCVTLERGGGVEDGRPAYSYTVDVALP